MEYQVFLQREQTKKVWNTFLRMNEGIYPLNGIVGPLGSGKTTLLQSWVEAERNKKNRNARKYFFYTSLMINGNFYDYILQLVQQLAEEIDENRLNAALAKKRAKSEATKKFLEETEQNILALYQQAKEAEAVGEKLLSCMEKLLDLYETLDLSVTIVMDEFDYARELGEKSGDRELAFRFLYSLAMCLKNNKKIHIFWVSNRRIGQLTESEDLAVKLEAVSNTWWFPVVASGEIQEYFAAYDKKSHLSAAKKERIRYYCGAHMGLLQKYRILFDTAGKLERFDIDNVFEENREEFYRIYDYFYQKLKLASASEQGVSLVEEFLRMYDTEKTAVDVKSRVIELRELGIVYRTVDGYQPLSAGFFDYVMTKEHPEKAEEIEAAWTEQKMKEKEEVKAVRKLFRYPIASPEDIDALIGKQVMYCHEKKTSAGGAQGFIVEPRFGATISPKRRKGLVIVPGMDLEVVIRKWNPNTDMFEVVPLRNAEEVADE